MRYRILVAAGLTTMLTLAAAADAGKPKGRPLSGDKQASLLDLIPARAQAAFVVRKNAARYVADLLFADEAGLRKELSDFQLRSLGVDLTRIEALSGFALGLTASGPESMEVTISLDSPPAALKLPEAGRSGGVALYQVVEGLWAARVQRGVVLGDRAGVEAAVAVDGGREPALAVGTGLGKTLGADVDQVDFAIAAVTIGLPPAQRLGVSEAVVTYHHAGVVQGLAHGDPHQLVALQGLIQGAIQKAVSQADEQRRAAVAASDPWAGSAAIIAAHRMRWVQRYVDPKLAGNQLSLTLEIPGEDDAGGMVLPTVAIVGVLAAVAIPAFMKYVRRSKTVEAAMNLRKLHDLSVAYYEGEHVDAKGRSRPKQFPPSVGWTPAESPCQFPGQKFPARPQLWNQPTWRALDFAIAEPSYYQYRYTASGRGATARFEVEARGDLDCDGVYSSFKRIGTVDAQGTVRSGAGLIVKDELE